MTAHVLSKTHMECQIYFLRKKYFRMLFATILNGGLKVAIDITLLRVIYNYFFPNEIQLPLVCYKILLSTGYPNNSKYWDTLSTYHTCPKIWNNPFYYFLMCLKYCCTCMYGKQCRPWSDTAFWLYTVFKGLSDPILRAIVIIKMGSLPTRLCIQFRSRETIKLSIKWWL